MNTMIGSTRPVIGTPRALSHVYWWVICQFMNKKTFGHPGLGRVSGQDFYGLN